MALDDTGRISLSREGEVFRLMFRYDASLVSRVKMLPYAAFDPETKTWTAAVCEQSLDILRQWRWDGVLADDPDRLVGQGEKLEKIAAAVLRGGTVRRPFLVHTAMRDDELYQRLVAIPGARWEKAAGAVSYPPHAAPALAELVDKGVVSDPNKLLQPAAVVVAYDARLGEFKVRGDDRAAEAFKVNFPTKDVMEVWRERGLDVAFADTFSEEMYLGELARTGTGLQPEGMQVDLYDYQKTDLAVALARSGVGIFSSMGVGKCLAPGSGVWMNGSVIPIDEAWERWAGSERVTDADNGEWAVPTAPLTVSSLNSDHKRVDGHVLHLYRQRVQETLRRVTLDDGSVITATRAHRFLSESSGWTNNIAVGDYLAVSRTAAHGVRRISPNVAELLAWQIAEGYEVATASRVCITQKASEVRDRIRSVALDVASELGLNFNSVPNHDGGAKTGHVVISSREWRGWLEDNGYRWGKLSAEKTIPDFIMEADEDAVRAFLRTFFAAEGTVVSANGIVEITTASPVLASQLRLLLARFSVWPRRRVAMKMATNGRRVKRPYTMLTFGGSSARTFARSIGFADPAKQKILDSCCARKVNSNRETLGTGEMLLAAAEVSGLPLAATGVALSCAHPGRRQGREAVSSSVAALDRILSGEARASWDASRLSGRGSNNLYVQRAQEAWNCFDTWAEALADVRDTIHRALEADVNWARVVRVEDIVHDGFVYDLEVAEHHNFVAEGVLCHNTILGIAAGHELMSNRHEVPRTIVVVPPSIRTQWRNEIMRFTGCSTDDIAVVDGDKKQRMAAYAKAEAGAKWLIVHYQAIILAEDTKRLEKLAPGSFIVFDECHRLKNQQAKTTKVAQSLAKKASRRMGLSGTPVENNPGEWYNVLSGLLIPGVFGTPIDFLNRYCYPGKFGGYEGAKNIAELRKRSKPLYVRHTFNEVATHLPPLRVQTLQLDPRPEYAAALKRAHREARDEIRDKRMQQLEKKGQGALDGYDRDEIEGGAEMTAVGMLRLLCSSPLIVARSESPAAEALKEGGLVPDEDGPKLDELRVMCAEMQSNNERVVVFSSSKRMANLIAERLEEDGVRYVLFTGDTSSADRDAAVKAFTTPGTEQDPGPTVFVATDAGAEGLNLGKCCSTLVNVDIPWTPGRLGQRNARVRRIDSTATSFLIVNLVVRGTIEEGILRMIEHKADLQDAILGESGGRKMTTGRGGRNIFDEAMAEWEKLHDQKS